MQPPVLRACCRTSSRCVPVSTMRSVGVSPSEPAAQRSRGRRCCACCACCCPTAPLSLQSRIPAPRTSQPCMMRRIGNARGRRKELLRQAAARSGSLPECFRPTSRFANLRCAMQARGSLRRKAAGWGLSKRAWTSKQPAGGNSSARACERPLAGAERGRGHSKRAGAAPDS